MIWPRPLGPGSGIEYGSLVENGLLKILSVNTWSPVVGTVCEEVDVALLEKVCEASKAHDISS